MINMLPISKGGAARMAALSMFVVALVTIGHAARGCEMLPSLHIDVTTEFDSAPVRTDYTLAEIAALARQQHRDDQRALFGFYTSEFGYSIQLARQGDQTCPAVIETTVTLHLRHRLIEIGQEASANLCVYPVALRHYRRLAEVDEQVVQRFGARTAAKLRQATQSLEQIHPGNPKGLDAALREQIGGIVDQAVAPLHGTRQDAQRSVNNAQELRQLAYSCSI